MAQLASGNSTSYPAAIDTKQVFRNATVAAPDSDTRLDSELANDSLDAILAIQTTLGAMPNGTYASLAARLNAFLPGGGPVTSMIPFTNQETITVLGAVHRLGTTAIRYQVYDAAGTKTQPGSLTIDASTYDVTVRLGTRQDGLLILSASGPYYVLAFTDSPGFTIAGTVHQLGTAALHYQAYAVTGNLFEAFEPGSVSVHPTTFDVTVGFAPNATGFFLVSASAPYHVTSFTGQSVVTVPGTTHLLGTKALFMQLYDAAVPANAIEGGSFTVNPTTFDAVETFGTPQSGSLILQVAGQLSGQDFLIQDAGVPDRTANRVFSQNGNLSLQSGGGNYLYLRSKTGTVRVTMDDAGRLGLGMTPSAYQLQLSTDSAAKPATNTWTIASDERLKEVRRAYTDGLALLLQLNPVWYRYNGLGGMPTDRKEHVGVLAQAVKPIAPYLVNSYRGKLRAEDPETDILTYEGHAVTFALINACKELHAQRAESDTRMALMAEALLHLQDQLTTLQDQLNALHPPQEDSPA